MKLPTIALALAATFLAAATAPAQGKNARSRVVVHEDGSTTESTLSPDKNVLTEATRDANNVLTITRIYRLDSKGRARHGLIMDGSKKLIGMSKYEFDSFDRLKWELVFNKDNRLIRKTLHRYDKTGNPLKPVAIDPETAKVIAANKAESEPFELGNGQRADLRFRTRDDATPQPGDNNPQGNPNSSPGRNEGDRRRGFNNR